MQKQIDRESIYGIVPVLRSERQYSFWDAFLIISGYAVATWCYTQGAYLATFLDFKQLITSTFGANIFFIAIISLPIIFAVRYGIDIWIWLRAIFGANGCKVMTVVIIVINFPWYAVCAQIFASSMSNLAASFGIPVPASWLPWLGVFCVLAGTAIALGGPTAIKWSSRILVPALLAVGVIVVFVAFTAAPISDIIGYKPDISAFANSAAPYAISVEGNFAFAFSWSCALAVLPRLCRREKDAYWATVTAYGVVAPFFVFAGGVMAIAWFFKTGTMISDPTIMLMELGGPVLALLSLLLVAFANIGTQGMGSYIYGLVLKSAFPKTDYRVIAIILCLYVSGLTLWGKVVEYFGAFISLSACIYGPIMALLFVDYFFIRKQKISLRSAYGVQGFNAYKYHKGFNLIGLACVIVGTLIGLLVYDPLTATIKSPVFYFLTASGTSFFATAIIYYVLSKIPYFSKYILKDRNELTIGKNS